MKEAPSWVADARPPVPAAVRARLADVDGPRRPDPRGLLADGLTALDRALSGASERGGAFALLAADALLTWAAEAALEAEDPGALLDAMVIRVAATGGGRDG